MTTAPMASAAIWVVGFATIATAALSPAALPTMIGALLALGVLMLAYRHLSVAFVVWLLVAGQSLEMALTDLTEPEAYPVIIAAVKATEISLVALMMVRFGVQSDRFNPAWAFVAMGALDAVVGIPPDLRTADMLRSLIGSITPFLIFFCVKPPGWNLAVRRAVATVPVLSVVLGSVLAVFGLRPVFVDSGGLRLSGLGHPAFLAGVCLPAIYVGLLHWLRTASSRAALLLGVNLVILFLTGARAPAAYAAIVVIFSLILVPDAVVPRAHRLVLVAAGLAAFPVLAILGETFGGFRLFELAAGDAGDLSGRDKLWPLFEAAAAQAPWFGSGIGSGNLVIPHDGPIVQLMHTWAAHNEYLRILVEGGHIGRGLLILLFVLWVTSHTRRLPRLERVVMRLVFLTYAAHAVTDNVLISTPACVFFAFVAAVFADPPGERLRESLDVA